MIQVEYKHNTSSHKKDQVKRTKWGPSTLLLHVVGQVVVHDVGGVVDLELGRDNETEKIIVREIFVRGLCVGSFELCHTFEETEQEGTSEVGRIDLLVAEFLQETAVTMVNGDLNKSKVQQVDILPIPIDMVGLVARRYRTYPCSCGHEMCFVRFVHCSNLRVTRVHIFLSHELVPDGDELLDPRSVGRLAVDTHVACAPHVGYGIVRDECTIRECVRDRRVVLVWEQNVAVIIVGVKRPDAGDDLINGHSSRGFGCRRDRQR